MTRTGIQVDGIVKRFGDNVALSDVSFDVRAGTVLGLLGPNGAGKTTMVSVLATLLKPDQGSAFVDGHDVATNADLVRQSISLTGQFAALDPSLTGAENLVLFGRLRGLKRVAAKQRASDLLDRFDLQDASSKVVSGYSGGMRRRLDLAASLVVDVPILFLDEPTTGLDPRSRAALWEMVRELRADGRTIILTTQYLEEADQLADWITLVDGGRVVEQGTPDDLKRRAGGQSCVLTPADSRQLEYVGTVLSNSRTAAVDTEQGTVTVPEVEAGDLVDILRCLGQANVEVADISLRRPTLDEVFLEMTAGSR